MWSTPRDRERAAAAEERARIERQLPDEERTLYLAITFNPRQVYRDSEFVRTMVDEYGHTVASAIESDIAAMLQMDNIGAETTDISDAASIAAQFANLARDLRETDTIVDPNTGEVIEGSAATQWFLDNVEDALERLIDRLSIVRYTRN